MMTRRRLIVAALLLAGCSEPAQPGPADGSVSPDNDDGGGGPSFAEAFLATELLTRPTDRAVTVSLVPAMDLDVYVEHRPAGMPAAPVAQTASALRPRAVPFAVLADGLAAGAAHEYRVRFRRPGEAGFQAGPWRTVHTARPPGSTFRFTVQADSHLDENSDLDLYRRALGNVASDGPDFHVDLGDTFMCEKHPGPLDATDMTAPDQPTVEARYLYERANFGIFAHSAPLFLVNGNHEGEQGFLFLGMGMDIATWATQARQRYYPSPLPDGFYGGDAMPEPIVGVRGSYYSFQWGDALFVMLDPDWYTASRSKTDAWVWTLGPRQFDWLGQTLATSKAKYKFIFIHHLVGGFDGTMRGGIEAAPYYEWGGLNEDGSAGFATKRPNWGKPIHQTLVENKVTAVFHGHDHVYVKQDLDGIVYQEVPQPSAKITDSGAMLAAKFHYKAGTILSSSGHIRVTVAPDKITSEYVRAWLPASEGAMRKNGEIAHAWTAAPR